MKKRRKEVGLITLQVSTPENDQTYLNNSLATADELFECVWPILWDGHLKGFKGLSFSTT